MIDLLPFLTAIIILITAGINCLKSYFEFRIECKKIDNKKRKASADNSEPSKHNNTEE